MSLCCYSVWVHHRSTDIWVAFVSMAMNSRVIPYKYILCSFWKDFLNCFNEYLSYVSTFFRCCMGIHLSLLLIRSFRERDILVVVSGWGPRAAVFIRGRMIIIILPYLPRCQIYSCRCTKCPHYKIRPGFFLLYLLWLFRKYVYHFWKIPIFSKSLSIAMKIYYGF